MDDTREPFVFLSEDEFNQLSIEEKVAYLRRAVEAVLFPRLYTSHTSNSDDKNR